MPDLHVYSREELPRELAIQIRSYVRTQWPFLTQPPYELWDPNVPSMHFVMTEGELLCSHASVRLRPVTHGEQTYACAGLSSVFTYPDFRQQRLAHQVVSKATAFIQSTEADIALLFCGEAVSPLYIQTGWTALPTAKIIYGTPPQLKSDNLVMGLFVSSKGEDFRPMLEREEVHVGANTW